MSSKFELISVLGSGTYGDAWLARNVRNNRKCVVKVIKIKNLSSKEMDQCMTEVSVLARCKHPNIISYMDAYVTETSLNIAMEYADGGDLHKAIVNQKGIHFSKEVVIDWFVQICFALKYIHSRNILHRDLKSQNIFLSGHSIVKLGDFGIARVLRDDADHAMTTIGTPYYLSPEICQRQPYNFKSDMWAAGCVLYELCCLHVPFNAVDFNSLVIKIMQGKYDPIPRHYGNLLEHLTHKLLLADPAMRPSAQETLALADLRPYVLRYHQRNKRPSAPGDRGGRRQSFPKDIPNQSEAFKEKRVAEDQKQKRIGDGEKSVCPANQIYADKSGEHVPLKPIKKLSDNVGIRNGSIEEQNAEKKERIVMAARRHIGIVKQRNMSNDKENLDPRRLSGKTFAVKNPKFRHVSDAVTPKIRKVIAKQRASFSSASGAERRKPSKESSRKSEATVDVVGRSKESSRTEPEFESEFENDQIPLDDNEVFTCNNNLFRSFASDDVPYDVVNNSRDGPIIIEGRTSLGAPSRNPQIQRSKLPKRSTSYDNLSKIKQEERSNQRALSEGNIKQKIVDANRVNKETYVVQKNLEDRRKSLQGKRTIAGFIGKVMFDACVEATTSGSSSANSVQEKISELFGNHRTNDLLKFTADALESSAEFAMVEQTFSERELVYFPLIALHKLLLNLKT